MIALDSIELNVREMSEDTEVILIQSDKWEDEQYKRKVRVYGTIRRWTLECFEDDVDYANSAYKHFQDKAREGNALSFIVDEANSHQISTNVYILSISLSYRSSMIASNHREFTMALQEAL